MAAEKAQLYALFKNPKLSAAFAGPAEGSQAPSVYEDPSAHAAWHAKKEAGDIIRAFLGNLAGMSDEAKAAADAVVAEQERTVEIAGLQQFADENPDFSDYFDAIKELVDTRGFKAREAYYMLKGRAAHAAPALGAPASPARDPVADARRNMRTPGRSLPAAVLPPTPTGYGGGALQDWYDLHPGTRERDATEYERRGTL